MEINNQQYMDDYIKVAKSLDKAWCFSDDEINELKGCLVRIAFYVENKS